MRPAHLHFLIHKPGFKTIASQVYDPEDPHLETDSQFGVTRALIADYKQRPDGELHARVHLRDRAGRGAHAEGADHREGRRGLTQGPRPPGCGRSNSSRG